MLLMLHCNLSLENSKTLLILRCNLFLENSYDALDATL